MKIVCNSSDLNNACARVQGVVEGTTTIPALQGILFSAADSSVNMTGYNLETGITTCIKAHIEVEGSVILDARRASDIFRNLPANTVLVETDEKNLCTIKSGDAVFTIIGMPAQEYPELPSVNDGTVFTYSRQLLKSMVKQTRYAVAKTDIKPVHKGILFEIKGDEMKMVAVDGYRLAIRTERAPANTGDMRFIVPEKAMSELIKLYNDEPGEVKVSVGSRHIIFEADGYFVISRLMEGDFIDYRTAVPKVITTKVKAETKKITDCIERMSLLITDRLKSPVRLTIEENVIKSSCATTLGNSNDKVEVLTEGSVLEIGFNNSYLLDALKNTECDEINLEFGGPLAPVKIMPPTGESFLFLVLPVRLAPMPKTE